MTDSVHTSSNNLPLAIECRNVTRVYRLPRNQSRKAVDSLNLDVPQGVVFGFLGANGAGKTTTIKMLLGFLRPTGGELRIFDEPCSEHTTRRHVGYLPEQPYFPAFMSPQEVLRMHADLLGLRPSERDDQIDSVLEITHLSQNRNLPLSRLSKGNQQRVGIAQALLGRPRLLILDEPTSGLDPLGRHEMRQIIARMRSEGRTVFLSSHVLSEIDTLCDQITVLNKGRVVACGKPSEVKQPETAVRIVTSSLTASIIEDLQTLGIEIDEPFQTTIECSAEQIYPVIGVLERAGAQLLSVSSGSETLEEAFLRLAA
ncbi:MAG: ABC transporter ATP-binding protein [Armatimonadetes bacterium]|nr:ABC transporter ATP-binding protein [Armatimonadota bacterium]